MTHQATAKMFAAVGIAAASAATAWSNLPDRFLVLWGYLLLGPFAGFLVGLMGTDPIGDWAPTVAVTTAVSVSPLIKAFRAKQPARSGRRYLGAGRKVGYAFELLTKRTGELHIANGDGRLQRRYYST